MKLQLEARPALPSAGGVTIVTAAAPPRRYLLFIEHGETSMTAAIQTKFASLALAAALLLPGALATLNQAAQIVA